MNIIPVMSDSLIKMIYTLFTNQGDTREPSNSKHGVGCDLIVAIILMDAITDVDWLSFH